MLHLTVNLLNAYEKRVKDKGRVSLISYLKCERDLEGKLVVVPEIVKDSKTFNLFANSMAGNAKETCIATLEDGTLVDMLFVRAGEGTVEVLASKKLVGNKRIEINLGGLE